MTKPAPTIRSRPDEPARILVIEDDPVTRYNIRSYLEDSGYKVDEAEDGVRGIAMVQEAHPDLVLCDLRMPGMDGLMVLRRLHLESLELPVIAVSGTGVLGDAVEALREGAWDFVVKPIQDMAVLEHAIEGALEKASLIRQNNHYQRQIEQANRTLREQLRQIEEDADAGRRIQLQMMPPAEEQVFGEYRFSRCLLPSMYLSGDFVDYFPIDPQRVGFLLADVSGHGVSSAFVTVLIKSFMQRSLERLHRDGEGAVGHPLRMLQLLNESILHQGLDKYLTIFYGVVDCRAGRLDYANAGQFPSPMLLDGAAAHFLPGRGMPVGLFPEPQIEAATLDLPPGCSLDAVFGRCAGGDPGGLARRTSAVAAGSSGRHAVPAAGLVERLGLDPGRAYPDDVAASGRRRGEATVSEGKARYAQEAGTWIIKLEGEVRHTLAPAVNAVLDRAFADPGLRHFVIDLSATQAIDSTSLGVLARIANHMTGRGLSKPTLLAPGRDICTILCSVCFDRIFHVVTEAGEGDISLEELPALATDEREVLALVLDAHRRLCAIDERNRQVFQDVVELLDRDLGRR